MIDCILTIRNKIIKDTTMKDTTPIFLSQLDDMKWLWHTHLKKFPKLWYVYRSAEIFGNEDCPVKIYLYKKEQPLYTTKPNKTFVLNDDLEYIEKE